jgi:hypothetical protein
MRSLTLLTQRKTSSHIILTLNIAKGPVKMVSFQEMDSVCLATVTVARVRILRLAVFLAKMR